MHDPRQSLTTARLVMIAAPCILVLGALIPSANAEPDHRRVHVEYADLDLSEDAGRATLDRRLNRAIRNVCRAPFTRSARAATHARTCAEQVRESVLAQRDTILANATKGHATHTQSIATQRDHGTR